MLKLKSSRNYIIIKNKSELKEAKDCNICSYIILEDSNCIYVWEKLFRKWEMTKYTYFTSYKEKDLETTCLKAYQEFYRYCGREEVERMKHILSPIEIWESCEQMHYANIDFIGEKLYQPIFEFDVNSSFTYGATQLPDGFQPLKEYMLHLFELKKNSNNQITRSKYKNLMNFLIGYFARVKEFVSLRSEIIRLSNNNIIVHMKKILANKGNVYLSNTDSIVTDEKGAEVMLPIISDDLGKFKLSKQVDRLTYNSSNCYQIGDKVVYSGVNFFCRRHTDLFKEQSAKSHGHLLEGFNFKLTDDNSVNSKVCCIKYGSIEVNVYNKIGENIDNIIYKIGDNNEKINKQ